MVKHGMTTDKMSSTSNQEVVISSNNGRSEISVLPITGHKLNGHNFLQQSQSVMMFICRKGKDNYLTGTAMAPRKEDPKFKVWKSENNMVMSWLINFMNNDIGENFMFYGRAKDIQDAAKETYSNNEDTVEVFEIKTFLHDLQQGELSVTQYFNTLTHHWQQVDMFEELQWECPVDSIKYKKNVEKERIFKFMLDLNKNLDEARGRILGIKPLSSIQEAFFEVQREESWKKVIMRNHSISTTIKNSILFFIIEEPSMAKPLGLSMGNQTSGC